jgi:hypothetical protein
MEKFQTRHAWSKEAVRWTMVERTDCPAACEKGLDGCATGTSTFARVEA